MCVCAHLIVCVCAHLPVRVCAQSEFWQELLKPVPSLARLHEAGSAIQRAIAQSDSCFKKQLALSANSVQTMRRYAQFLDEVC